MEKQKDYVIYYIDGNDLKYKTFITTAGSTAEAVRKMRDSYESDFDHQIIEVCEQWMSEPEHA